VPVAVDWSAVVIEILRYEFPGLPQSPLALPDVVLGLIPIWAARLESMDPTVSQESLGAYAVTFRDGGGSGLAWLGGEAILLRRYRRPMNTSVTLENPNARINLASVYDLLHPAPPVIPTPPTPPGVAFIFTQSTPSSLWVIPHSLGRLPHSITSYSQAGDEVMGSEGNPSLFVSTIAFNTPLAGTAHLT
jgi:hypothetical protein